MASTLLWRSQAVRDFTTGTIKGDSIVLLAVVGPNYEFLYVDLGANGRMSDGGIWNRCNFKQCLMSSENPLPSRSTPVSHVIVGDDAFGMTEHLMKSFPQTQMHRVENRIYNYRYFVYVVCLRRKIIIFARPGSFSVCRYLNCVIKFSVFKYLNMLYFDAGFERVFL